MSTSLIETLAGLPQPPNAMATAEEPVATVLKPTAAGVYVLPYNAHDDNKSEQLLPWLWHKMQQDDLVDYYFPGQEQTGFASFVGLFSGVGGTHVALLTIDAESKQPEDTVIGFITWQPMAMGVVTALVIGCIFFRKFWDHAITDRAAVASLKFWFDSGAEVLVGVCPALHRTIALYNRRIGLVETGRIPMAHIYKGKPCDAVLWCLTRKGWLAKEAV